MTTEQIKELSDIIATKDAQIAALQIQLIHQRDLTIHRAIRSLGVIIPHDDNARAALQEAYDILHAQEYQPLVVMPLLQ